MSDLSVPSFSASYSIFSLSRGAIVCLLVFGIHLFTVSFTSVNDLFQILLHFYFFHILLLQNEVEIAWCGCLSLSTSLCFCFLSCAAQLSYIFL